MRTIRQDATGSHTNRLAWSLRDLPPASQFCGPITPCLPNTGKCHQALPSLGTSHLGLPYSRLHSSGIKSLVCSLSLLVHLLVWPACPMLSPAPLHLAPLTPAMASGAYVYPRPRAFMPVGRAKLGAWHAGDWSASHGSVCRGSRLLPSKDPLLGMPLSPLASLTHTLTFTSSRKPALIPPAPDQHRHRLPKYGCLVSPNPPVIAVLSG